MKTINKPMTAKQAYKKIYSASRTGGLLELLLVVDEVTRKGHRYTAREIVGCIDRIRIQKKRDALDNSNLAMRLSCYRCEKREAIK